MDEEEQRAYYESEIGLIEIRTTKKAVTFLEFVKDGVTKASRSGIEETRDTKQYPVLKKCLKQLDEYFKGNRTRFDLPLAAQGTDFQRRVWDRLSGIPFGATLSYKEMAESIGNPKAMRAVGGANGRNPISIIVPCHRVIAHDGSLGGYGGGLWRKEWLLDHERRFSSKKGEPMPDER